MALSLPAGYRLATLAEVPQCLAEVARWQHEQWQVNRAPAQLDLFARSESEQDHQQLAERTAQLRQHLGASLIPITFVILTQSKLTQGKPVASVSLVHYKQSGSAKGGVPWLTNMYVVPEHRGLGLAQALLRRAEDYALAISQTRLYLHALGAEGFYLQRGWLRLKTQVVDGKKLRVLVRHLAFSAPPSSSSQ